MRAVAMLVAVAGCGRFGFGSTSGDRDGAATGDSVKLDGARGDGAGGDSSLGDGGTGDGAAPACLPAYSVCDEFEGSGFDTTTWTVDAPVTLDTTLAHRGAQS